MTFFESVSMLPEDPIVSIPGRFAADTRPTKINLGVGSYKDEQGKPYLFSSVQKAEAVIFAHNLNKEYLPIEGSFHFIQEASKLLFGQEFSPSPAIFSAQTIGGTGALRLGGEFLTRETSTTIFVPDHTWPNHTSVFKNCGMVVQTYPYYNETECTLDFQRMCEAIRSMPKKSVILLHACCQNPTGFDPSFSQWEEISSLILKQQIIPFFDFAYQGFGEGLEEDARAIRYFFENQHEMLIASSYSKNFGLYGERIGLLSVVTHDKEIAHRVASQIKYLIRSNYSSPPLHSERIITTILKSKELYTEWVEELNSLRERLQEMRSAIAERLAEKNFPFALKILKQKGMFSYCGISKDQVNHLLSNFAIYLPQNGRISICGLNWNNLDYVVKSITQVI